MERDVAAVQRELVAGQGQLITVQRELVAQLTLDCAAETTAESAMRAQRPRQLLAIQCELTGVGESR